MYRQRDAKRSILAAVLLGLIGVTLPARSEPWVQQAPLPTFWDLDGVVFLTLSHGFICGNDRVLMETTDGGTTWSQVSSVSRDRYFTEDEFHDIAFADPLHGWAVGNVNVRTTDGGQSWEPMGLIGGTNYELRAISPQIAYVRSGWNLFKTTDGGVSWFQVFPDDGIDRVNSMDWWDADRGVFWGGGYAPGSVSGLYRTTDGGASWELVRAGHFREVTFLAAAVLLFDDGTMIRRSDDFGETDFVVFSDPRDGMEVIHRVDEDTVVMMDGAHRIWVSDDDTQTWTLTQEALGFRGLQWPGVHFLDPLNGWMASANGLLLQTTDGGQTWTQRSQGVGVSLEAIAMYPDGRGLATGELGTVIETDDFGRTWTLEPMLVGPGGITGDLADLDAVGGARVFLVSGSGAVFRSDDRGADWQLIETSFYNPNAIYHVIDFVSDDVGFVFGRTPTFGAIHRSTDGGGTWQLMMGWDHGEEVQIDAQMFDSDRGVSVGTRDVFYTTADGWQSWSHRVVDFGDSWTAIGFGSVQVGWIGGFFGTLVKTTDGGTTWSEQLVPGLGSDRIAQIEAASDVEVRLLAVGNDRIRVFETPDGGASWNVSDPGVQNPDGSFTSASDFAVLPGGEIWTAGMAGFVLASELPATAGVGPVTDSAPAWLSVSTTPYPVESHTELRFTLPVAGRVWVGLFDVQGRRIETLADDWRPAGEVRLEWDVAGGGKSAVRSGAYFYLVRTPAGTARGKLLVVR